MFFRKRAKKTDKITKSTEKDNKIKCEHCRQIIDIDMKSCPYCGYRNEKI